MINPRTGAEDHPRVLEIEIECPIDELRINLGCGFNVLSGWLNVDKYVQGNKDIVCWSLSDLSYVGKPFDLAYSSHSLEHMNLKDACLALKEWYRVLKLGGQLIIAVPDTEAICRKFIDNPEWYTQCLYGTQTGPGHIHYYGWTKSSLMRVLDKIGFKEIKTESYNYGTCPSIWCEALK